jgi:hypothetical protein
VRGMSPDQARGQADNVQNDATFHSVPVT